MDRFTSPTGVVHAQQVGQKSVFFSLLTTEIRHSILFANMLKCIAQRERKSETHFNKLSILISTYCHVRNKNMTW